MSGDTMNRITAASHGFRSRSMSTLARFSVGRVLLHLFATVGDGQVRFHFAGILRELPSVGVVLTLLMRARSRMTEPAVNLIFLPRTDPHWGDTSSSAFGGSFNERHGQATREVSR